MAERVMALPETGKVVVAHPDLEAAAIHYAEHEDCPYYLDDYVDDANVFVLDVDAWHVGVELTGENPLREFLQNPMGP